MTLKQKITNNAVMLSQKFTADPWLHCYKYYLKGSKYFEFNHRYSFKGVQADSGHRAASVF